MINYLKAQKENLIIFVTYFLSFGLILFNNGLYWDDWVLFRPDIQNVFKVFEETGLIWFDYLHYFLLSLPFSIFFYKFLTFLLFLTCAFLFKNILKSIKEINHTARFFLVLFFALIPLNFARITITLLPYTLAYFLFFLGFFLLVKYLQKRILIYRFLSLLFFFILFTVNSFLVFYLIVILYILYVERKNFRSWKLSLVNIWRYADFVIIPFVFWTMKKIYFQSYGVFATYNQITWSNFDYACRTTLKISYQSLMGFLNSLFHPSLEGLLFSTIIFIGGLLFYQLIKFIGTSDDKKPALNWLFFLFGLFAFLLALLPYLAVGLVPRFLEWTSRYFLLAPLGLSLVIYYGLRMFFLKIHLSSKLQCFLYGLIVITFIMVNFSFYLSFQRDWLKELSLMEHFTSSEAIKNNTTFLFIDNTSLNAINRTYRFYEYNGLMKMVFQNETRFGTPKQAFHKIEDYQGLIQYPTYNMTNYQLKNPQYEITINEGGYKLSAINIFKFYYWRWFNLPEYEKNLKNIIQLEYKKLD